ncbi:MAG: flagellar hook-length control protein FliK [Oxalobacter formigenes]|nr:flagellar hook-length control protein FliK [Oxalobacter formigenes]
MDLLSDLAGTRAVSQTAAVSQVSPAGDLRQDVYARLMTLAVGRPVAAEVVSRTDNGAAMVRVADTVVQMDLPQGAKTGEKITLTLLAREPRLTFLFEREPAAHSMVSNTGRLIDSILRSVSRQEGNMPAALTGRAPLFPTPAASPAAALLSRPGLAAAFEAALTNLFDTSGLFYESHLAQWVAGERPQEALMAEPQARMQPPAPEAEQAQGQMRPGGEKTADSAAARPPQAAAPDPDAQMDRLERLQEKSWVQSLVDKAASRLSGGTALPQQETRPASVVDAHAAQMIRMQLDTLEQRKVVWQGEFWPGQKLEWEVEDKTPRKQHKANSPAVEKSWQSVLRVNLPLLGPVTATMRLTGDAVQVQIGADDEEAMPLLRQFGPELASALEDAGARLDFFTVNDEAA